MADIITARRSLRSQAREKLQGAAITAVDRGSKTPAYFQIFAFIRSKMLDGTFADGDLLPSEHDLVPMFGVSRITAQRAMEELVAAKLAVRERGRGTRAVVPSLRQNVQGSIGDLMKNLVLLGQRTTARLLSFEYAPASEEVAQALRVPTGAPVQKAIRVRYLEGEPLSHITTFLPEELGRTFDQDGLATVPLQTLLRQAGVEVIRAEQAIGATMALVDTAAELKVDVGSPLVQLKRTLFDEGGRAVEYVVALYRDNYEYNMTLTRDGDNWLPAGS